MLLQKFGKAAGGFCGGLFGGSLRQLQFDEDFRPHGWRKEFLLDETHHAIDPAVRVEVKPVLERASRMLQPVAKERGVALRCQADAAAAVLATSGDVDTFTRAFFREFGLNPSDYAKAPVPIPLFIPYGAKFRELRKESTDMSVDSSIYGFWVSFVITSVSLPTILSSPHVMVLDSSVKLPLLLRANTKAVSDGLS